MAKNVCSALFCEKPRHNQYCNMHRMRLAYWGSINRININLIELPKIHLKTIAWMHRKRFGGLREFIFDRDNNACVSCGMTQEEHLKEFKCHLTINHIDHQGRRVKNPNNDPDNLETLCLRCHGSKDAIIHGRYSKYRYANIG